ncbi:hypothetical protein [Paralysiella testudinis]|uniref:Uncharacterized protein n=1 Tax=Paralysiella testudinis TaxID=2809020 RepID=A0A892ZDW5_9NEIS|nr:hypothetical protein [Paralysiella testudinis]QRQ80853.1 hypothetical protein JQU52_08820 [Paralysiella testudinis]
MRKNEKKQISELANTIVNSVMLEKLFLLPLFCDRISEAWKKILPSDQQAEVSILSRIESEYFDSDIRNRLLNLKYHLNDVSLLIGRYKKIQERNQRENSDTKCKLSFEEELLFITPDTSKYYYLPTTSEDGLYVDFYRLFKLKPISGAIILEDKRLFLRQELTLDDLFKLDNEYQKKFHTYRKHQQHMLAVMAGQPQKGHVGIHLNLLMRNGPMDTIELSTFQQYRRRLLRALTQLKPDIEYVWLLRNEMFRGFNLHLMVNDFRLHGLIIELWQEITHGQGSCCHMDWGKNRADIEHVTEALAFLRPMFLERSDDWGGTRRYGASN